MQSIDHLIDLKAVYFTEKGKTFQDSVTFQKYSYRQIPLDLIIQEHCNFKILGGCATGTY